MVAARRVGFGVVLEKRREEKNNRISNKALKVQNPADGVLPLTADVGPSVENEYIP